MKDELAERFLATMLEWSASQIAQRGASLQALASLKYDEYEGFPPGEAFLEHLAAWISAMDSPDRETGVQFVEETLLFISRAELTHLIDTIYPDVVRPFLVDMAARRLGFEAWQRQRIVESPAFNDVQRRTLVLGLGDGAQIDRLRRASDLSHEQFCLSPELPDEQVERLHQKLLAATRNDPDPLFEQVVLVEDFAGSGYTLIRQDSSGEWDGRLERARRRLEQLVGKLVSSDHAVMVLIYIGTERASDWLVEHLRLRKLDWHLRIVQTIPKSIEVTDPSVRDLCQRYFDPAILEILGDHVSKKEGDIRLGFGEGSLPLILSHNTPNNSLSFLWADTTDLPGSRNQQALFPRRHRHNASRP